MRVNPSEVTTVDELSSKQEEVDTSVILDYILLGEDWESNTELIVAFESLSFKRMQRYRCQQRPKQNV